MSSPGLADLDHVTHLLRSFAVSHGSIDFRLPLVTLPSPGLFPQHGTGSSTHDECGSFVSAIQTLLLKSVVALPPTE